MTDVDKEMSLSVIWQMTVIYTKCARVINELFLKELFHYLNILLLFKVYNTVQFISTNYYLILLLF